MKYLFDSGNGNNWRVNLEGSGNRLLSVLAHCDYVSNTLLSATEWRVNLEGSGNRLESELAVNLAVFRIHCSPPHG